MRRDCASSLGRTWSYDPSADATTAPHLAPSPPLSLMPLRLGIKVKLQKRSERVKWVDMHPTEPWLLSALYSGNVFIWNYETENMVKSFDVIEQMPIRSAKFVARNQWFVCGADDQRMRVYNYNTSELVKAWEAHGDYIRCVEVHLLAVRALML